jgi:tetratricopeptide (TPR) repeat protein
MLTGHHPYCRAPTGLVEGASIICNTPPRGLRSWGRPFDEDLETIVLKALEKEPAMRYQSVLALSEDLQRYLNDLPIHARPPSTLYQFRKLFHRHRLAFAALGVVLTLIVAFGVISVIQGQRIRAERDRANLEAENAKQANEFLAGLFRHATPGRGGSTADLSARDLLKQGRQRVDKDLANQPELRARLLDSIGSFYNTLLPYEEAIRAYNDSIAIRHKLYGEGGSIQEAGTWEGLSATEYNLGNYRKAAEFGMRGVAIRKKFPNEGKLSNPAMDLVKVADSYSQYGEHAKAVQLLNEAREWNRKYKAPPADDIAILEAMGQIYRRQGQYRNAIRALTQSLALKRVHAPGMPVLYSLNEIGLAHNLGGDPVEAEKYFQEVLELVPPYYPKTHPNYAILSMNYAAALNLLGKHVEAEKQVRTAIAIFDKTGQTDHPSMGDFRWALGEALQGQGKDKEANVELRDALARNLRKYGEKELRTTNSYFHFATSELRLGRPQTALINVNKSLAMMETLGRTNIVPYGVAQMVKGQVLSALGRKDEARPYLERAQKQLLDLLGPDRIETKRAAEALASLNK